MLAQFTFSDGNVMFSSVMTIGIAERMVEFGVIASIVVLRVELCKKM